MANHERVPIEPGPEPDTSTATSDEVVEVEDAPHILDQTHEHVDQLDI